MRMVKYLEKTAEENTLDDVPSCKKVEGSCELIRHVGFFGCKTFIPSVL